LVDNGSRDDSLRFVRERFPRVHVLELGSNLGFGAAYNRLIAATSAPLVALLNNDTCVEPDWLATLSDEISTHPDTAVVGSKLLFLNRPTAVNHAGGRLTVFGSAFDVGFGAVDGPSFAQPGDTGCATGAAMLLRREAFLRAGGFDEHYFAYFEDADLCWRLWLSGHTVRLQPAARVLHAYGGSLASQRTAAFRVEHCQANRLQNMVKHLETNLLLAALPLSLAYDASRVVELCKARRGKAALALVRGSMQVMKGYRDLLDRRRLVQRSRRRSDHELFELGVLVGLRHAAREWTRLSRLNDVEVTGATDSEQQQPGLAC
jgi:GT2 family glycosyltransferase